MTVPDPSVLIVADGRPDALARSLESVRTCLPDADVHVWDEGPDVGPDVAVRFPEVTWTRPPSPLGPVVAVNRLARRVPPGVDMVQLRPGVELLGPLLAARTALAGPGVAAVAPTVATPGAAGRPWDVARRPPTVARGLVGAAGLAERWRGRSASELYATPPAHGPGRLVEGCLLVSGAAWSALGPYDERFFSDAAAAWQGAARRAGWSLRLVDDDGVQAHDPDAGPGPADRAGTVSRRSDLRRTSEILTLGLSRNGGRGAVLALGAAAADAVRRRRDRGRPAPDGPGAAPGTDTRALPAVVITTNGLANGGAERQRVLLAGELADRGHPVTVVCLQKLGRYTAELDPRVRLVLQPWWQPWVPTPGGETVLVGGVTNTEIGFALGWRTLGRAAGRRRWWMPATHDPARPERPTYSRGQALALRGADALLVLSARHHVDLTRHQRLTDRVVAAPNGIPPVAPRPFEGSDPLRPLRFVMLSRIVEYKNPLMLVAALDALGPARRGEWTLDIFGDGPDRARLEAATPEHLRDAVRWRGPSPGPDHAFAETDVLCVPSGFEAFPLVMVEAMARGVPVMASDSGTVGEMLDEGRAGIVVRPVTAEAWTAALRRALDDRGALAGLALAGRARALSHYTHEAMADDYQRAVAHLVGRAFPAGPRGPVRLLAGP